MICDRRTAAGVKGKVCKMVVRHDVWFGQKDKRRDVEYLQIFIKCVGFEDKVEKLRRFVHVQRMLRQEEKRKIIEKFHACSDAPC